jgi:hypothetical protein
MARNTTRSKAAQDTATLAAALKKHTAALKSHEQALNAHAAAMTSHAIAVTPAEARGACSIIFTDGRAPICVDNLTNTQCQERAAEEGGNAWPIVPGQKCFAG